MKIRTLLTAALAVVLACPAFADTKISQMPVGGSLTPGDIIPVVRSGTNYQATYTGAAAGVSTFNTRSGAVTLTAPDVGSVLWVAPVSHQFLTGLNTSGVFSLAQPAFTDISGTVAASQLPTPTTSALGGILAQASATAHQVVQYVNTSGQQILAQLGFSDLTGTISAAQLGTSYTNGQLLIGNTGTGQLVAGTLTAGTNITITNSAGGITINSSGGGGSMVYPGAGIANSTGSAWGTSYSTSGTGTVIPLTVSPTFTGTVKTGLLTASLNAASLPTALTGTVARVSNVNTTDSRLEVDAFGAVPRFSASAYGGTAASPTAVGSATEIGGDNAWAYNGSATVGPLAAVRFYTAEAQSSGHGGTYADIATTPIGTTAMAEVARFNSDGGITVPATVTGGDKGIGTINAAGLYVNGVAVGASSVSVTAATPNIVVTPSPGTGTFTVGLTDVINPLSTTTPYTVLSSDMGKTDTHNLGSAVAVTLPQAGTTGFAAGVSYLDLNLLAGPETVTPTTSTINGNASQILHKLGWIIPISDGSNWYGPSFPGYGTITTNALTKFIDASGATTASGITDNGTTIATSEAITLNGSSSGSVTLGVPSAAGTGTVFTLPSTNGTNHYILQTDGSGVTSWVVNSSSGVTFPATGSIVVSAGVSSQNPTGISEVDNDCVVGSSGSWVAGSCSGTSSSTLGTSNSSTSPQISGSPGNGFYTAGAGLVDVSIGSSKLVEWASTGQSIISTGANALSVGVGATNPSFQVNNNASSPVNGIEIVGEPTGTTPIITNEGSDANGIGTGIAIQGKSSTSTGAGGLITLTSGAGGTSNGTGGALTMVGGAGGASNGPGGAVSLAGGAASGSGTSGAATLSSGNAGSGNTGTVTIQTAASGSGSGAVSGPINISTGNSAGSAGSAGLISLTTGSGHTSGGSASTIILTTGNGGTTGSSALIELLTGNGGSTSGNSGNIELNTGTVTSGTAGIVTTNSGVAIGTTTLIASTELTVNGTINQSAEKSCSTGLTTDSNGSINGCVASDESLKRDIKTLVYDAGLIDRLHPVIYSWNDPIKYDGRQHQGFIAQEVASVDPFAVKSAGNGLLGIDNSALDAIIIGDLQAIHKRLDAPHEYFPFHKCFFGLLVCAD